MAHKHNRNGQYRYFQCIYLYAEQRTVKNRQPRTYRICLPTLSGLLVCLTCSSPPPPELLEIIYLYYIVTNPIFHETKLIYACGGQLCSNNCIIAIIRSQIFFNYLCKLVY